MMKSTNHTFAIKPSNACVKTICTHHFYIICYLCIAFLAVKVACLAVLGLQNELRSQKEQIQELDENVTILRKELNKTEQARKETSIKVR